MINITPRDIGRTFITKGGAKATIFEFDYYDILEVCAKTEDGVMYNLGCDGRAGYNPFKTRPNDFSHWAEQPEAAP
jgi:hypothetical protein